MLDIVPEINIYYYDDIALDHYLNRFYGIQNCKQVKKLGNKREYIDDHYLIRCIKGIPENSRGYKAHFIAVQEELTWNSNWPMLHDCILMPQVISPIPIHIFDGIPYEEAKAREDTKG